MFARIRKSMKEEQGFTLIELLVVMIIIGILAAIAIPVFLNQRKSAVDASMKSDLRSAATVVETYFVDNQKYPADNATFAGLKATKDAETTITYTPGTGAAVGAYCLHATRADGAQEGTDPGTWDYDSDGGGLLKNHGTCAVPVT